MNHSNHSGLRIAANVVAVLGTFFILAGLIWIMYHYTRPEAVEQAHWNERQKNLAELRAQNKEMLENYAYIDAARGVVRLPISRAMELTAAEWQSPALGRSNLLARLEKMTPAGLTGANIGPATNAPAPASKQP